jgi:hypothetical protein
VLAPAATSRAPLQSNPQSAVQGLRARAERRARARTVSEGLRVSRSPTSLGAQAAWAGGARGEEILAKRLDGPADQGVFTLHDRRLGDRANIGHIAIAPSGVYVIDAKRYKSRPTCERKAARFGHGPSLLFVGSRDCAIGGMHGLWP